MKELSFNTRDGKQFDMRDVGLGKFNICVSDDKDIMPFQLEERELKEIASFITHPDRPVVFYGDNDVRQVLGQIIKDHNEIFNEAVKEEFKRGI